MRYTELPVGTVLFVRGEEGPRSVLVRSEGSSLSWLDFETENVVTYHDYKSDDHNRVSRGLRLLFPSGEELET